MKCNKRSLAVVSVLFALLLSLSTRTLNARDADLSSPTFAAAHTAKQQCIDSCRARYRDCQSLKQIELSPKVGDGGNREGGISWGCLTPPLLHRRSDMPCPTITSSI